MNGSVLNDPRTIAVVTGTRAEFGLLRPVMAAIDAHRRLTLRTLVTGTHLLPPAHTIDEIQTAFTIASRIEMQQAGEHGRLDDAAAVARGIAGFVEDFRSDRPDTVLVLGDRIEAFAAASAAAIAGIHVAHMHGGDRAEGIHDESLRHAITKLAHIHLTATGASTERVLYLGEDPARVHLVGSPAIDGLDAIAPPDDADFEALGSPRIVFLLHPQNADHDEQWANAQRLLNLCQRHGATLAMHPNHDPGRSGILEAIETASVPHCAHLERRQFIGLLKRCDVIVGNSSAGLIECAALGVRCINIGTRQAGREMPEHVRDLPDADFGDIDMALERAMDCPLAGPVAHPYGDGTAGPQTARVLATFDPSTHPITKRCTY